MVTLTLEEVGCSVLLLGLGHEARREAARSRTEEEDTKQMASRHCPQPMMIRVPRQGRGAVQIQRRRGKGDWEGLWHRSSGWKRL